MNLLLGDLQMVTIEGCSLGAIGNCSSEWDLALAAAATQIPP